MAHILLKGHGQAALDTAEHVQLVNFSEEQARPFGAGYKRNTLHFDTVLAAERCGHLLTMAKRLPALRGRGKAHAIVRHADAVMDTINMMVSMLPLLLQHAVRAQAARRLRQAVISRRSVSACFAFMMARRKRALRFAQCGGRQTVACQAGSVSVVSTASPSRIDRHRTVTTYRLSGNHSL